MMWHQTKELSQPRLPQQTIYLLGLTPQPLVASDLPGDEERKGVVGECGGGWGREVVHLAVQHVEAEVAHLRLQGVR